MSLKVVNDVFESQVLTTKEAKVISALDSDEAPQTYWIRGMGVTVPIFGFPALLNWPTEHNGVSTTEDLMLLNDTYRGRRITYAITVESWGANALPGSSPGPGYNLTIDRSDSLSSMGEPSRSFSIGGVQPDGSPQTGSDTEGFGYEVYGSARYDVPYDVPAPSDEEVTFTKSPSTWIYETFHLEDDGNGNGWSGRIRIESYVSAPINYALDRTAGINFINGLTFPTVWGDVFFQTYKRNVEHGDGTYFDSSDAIHHSDSIAFKPLAGLDLATQSHPETGLDVATWLSNKAALSPAAEARDGSFFGIASGGYTAMSGSNGVLQLSTGVISSPIRRYLGQPNLGRSGWEYTIVRGQMKWEYVLREQYVIFELAIALLPAGNISVNGEYTMDFYIFAQEVSGGVLVTHDVIELLMPSRTDVPFMIPTRTGKIAKVISVETKIAVGMNFNELCAFQGWEPVSSFYSTVADENSNTLSDENNNPLIF